MPITKSGMNISSLNDLTPLNISINTTSTDLINQAVSYATIELGSFFPSIVYLGMLVMFYVATSDLTPFGRFRYNPTRAICISLGLVCLISITVLSTGYIQSFKVVASFITSWILSVILVLTTEQQ